MTASTTPVARPSSTGRSGAGTNAGEVGVGLASSPASPARPHQMPCQVAHFHLTRDEWAACVDEHLTVMRRLERLA